MKRTLIAAAAVLAAGTAFAQSSVTLYGRVNTSVEYQKSSIGSQTALYDNRSRWGLRGSEDLGGGLKGIFLLESGFNVDNGGQASTGVLFNRESWVGLQGNFGRVRLGNMGPSAAYFAIPDYISMHNHDTGSSSDAFYLYPGKSTDTIAYNTPSFGGLVVEVQYGLKETNAAGAKNTAVVAANFDRGPLHLGASFVSGPTTVAGVTDQNSKELGLRALYELGSFTLGAYWVRNEADAAGLEGKRDIFRVSGMYTLGANEFHVNVGYADDTKVNGTTQANTAALQYTVGYNYNLSKRTKLFAFYTRIDNDSAASYNPFYGTTPHVVNPGFDPSSVAIGVRHNF